MSKPCIHATQTDWGFQVLGKQGGLSLRSSNTVKGGRRAIDCGDGDMTSNCSNWSDRLFSCGFWI